MSDWLKVKRVQAKGVATKMVKLKSGIEFTKEKFIRYLMSFFDIAV
jgi:hypothetical protein